MLLKVGTKKSKITKSIINAHCSIDEIAMFEYYMKC